MKNSWRRSNDAKLAAETGSSTRKQRHKDLANLGEAIYLTRRNSLS
jgi:hypothetical protein